METGAVRQNLFPPPVTVRSTEPADRPEDATVVPPEKAVQAANDTGETRPEAENGSAGDPAAASSPRIKREEYRDKITDSLVYRAIDTETGEVVRQIPEESLLRLRRAFALTTHQDMTGLGVNRSL